MYKEDVDFFVDSSQRNTGATKKLIIINILFDTVKDSDPTHEKETESDPQKNEIRSCPTLCSEYSVKKIGQDFLHTCTQ